MIGGIFVEGVPRCGFKGESVGKFVVSDVGEKQKRLFIDFPNGICKVESMFRTGWRCTERQRHLFGLGRSLSEMFFESVVERCNVGKTDMFRYLFVCVIAGFQHAPRIFQAEAVDVFVQVFTRV